MLDSVNILKKRRRYQVAYPAFRRNPQKGEPRIDEGKTPVLDDVEFCKVLHSIRRGWSTDKLRADQREAVEKKYPGFTIRCAPGAQAAAAFRSCQTQDKVSTHRLTFASWKPEEGPEKWYQMSNVELNDDPALNSAASVDVTPSCDPLWDC